MSVSDPARQPPAWYEAVDAVLDTDLPTTEKLLILALIVRAGLKPDGVAFQSLETLSRQISLGQETQDRNEREVRHVRRLLKNLETRKLVDSNKRPGMTTEHRIRWERLLHPGHPCPGSDSVSASDPGHPCPPTPDIDVLTGGTPVSSLPGHPCPPNIPLNLSHESPPSINWKEVEGELQKEGIALIPKAIAGAQHQGYSPARALLVVQHYRELGGAAGWDKGPGVLFTRITDVTADIPVEQGWPDRNADFVRREKETQRRATEANRKRQDDEQRGRDKEKLNVERERLEDEYGVECDDLTDDDIADMKASDPEFLKLLNLQKDWRSPRFRRSLLKARERRKLSIPATDDARGPPVVTTTNDGVPPTQTDARLPSSVRC